MGYRHLAVGNPVFVDRDRAQCGRGGVDDDGDDTARACTSEIELNGVGIADVDALMGCSWLSRAVPCRWLQFAFDGDRPGDQILEKPDDVAPRV